MTHWNLGQVFIYSVITSRFIKSNRRPTEFRCTIPSMPHLSRKQEALREIDNRISSLLPYISSSLFRRQIGLLLSLRKIHENSRYYQRIPHSSHYENHDYLFLRSSLLPSTDDKIIKTLHMNRAEFTSVVALFGDDEIFKSQGRKPQAPPKVQLATCIYRMAGGESIRTVQNHFNLSRKLKGTFNR